MSKRAVITDADGKVIHEKGNPFDTPDYSRDQEHNRQQELQKRKKAQDKLYKDAMQGI